MAGRPDLLPPFPALRAFHAAARHGQFRSAARDLGLTESAISHQVRRLEAHLHVSLFERQGPRVVLTDAGRRYFAEIDPALERIAAATQALIAPRDRDRVALTLPPSLAMLWLLPRLARFEADCPGVDLQLVTTTRLVDLQREPVDLAIRHGQGAWPTLEAELLFSERTLPVCRPGYLPSTQAGDPLPALTGCRLLINSYFPDEWTEWSRANGAPDPDLSTALRLDSQEQVLEAAEQGLGLAMGRSPLVDGRLAAGRLVAPFGVSGHRRAAYYLCHRHDLPLTAGVRKVARWLRAVATAEQEIGPVTGDHVSR